MNPWAVILALIAVGCLIVAYEGSQDNVLSAITAKGVTTKSATTTSTAPAGSTGITLT